MTYEFSTDFNNALPQNDLALIPAGNLIGIEGAKRNAKGEDTWGMNGRTMIRSILESARNIHPNDRSQSAIEGRTINDLLELMGIEFGIKIGVEEDKSGNYQPKNTVLSIITPNYSSYASVMGVSGRKSQASSDAVETETPVSSAQPSWINR